MDKDQLARRLMATFLEELKDQVAALNRGLLALEKGPGPAARSELLASLFRGAHSLKGAARSVGVSAVESRCHQLEEILASVRDGRGELTADLFAAMFSALDELQEAGRLLAGGGEGARSPAAPPAGQAGPAEDGFMRVPARKLDLLVAQSGELLVARRRIESRAEEAQALLRGKEDRRALEAELERFAARLAADLRALEQAALPLEESVRRVRMLPFSQACEGLERAARDLAKAGGKDVEVLVDGGEAELDQAVLEGLRHPLLHLLRNAVDHGIEPPEARRKAAKAPRGRVAISARVHGSRVEISVEDDGRGIDLPAVRERAAEKGLSGGGDEELARLILLPGFSTSRALTEVSGRGVGLDVVNSAVEALHGSLDFSSQPGRGSRFVLTVPLTLTTVRALLVSAGGRFFLFAGANVDAVARLGREDLRSVEGRDMALLGQTPLPVASLAELLGLRAAEPPWEGQRLPVVILAVGALRAAFIVDEILSEQEIVIKRLGNRLLRVRRVGGAALLPSGRIALKLNAAELIRDAAGRSPARSLAEAFSGAGSAAKRKTVLLVEDSITTRTLIRSILEGAGYHVRLAADGAEAWQRLQEEGADIVVSDVEMPRMDGFALTEAIRASKRFQGLPVVLVTALERDEEKARGIQAGADAYLMKSAFDQKALLDAMAQLL